MPERDQLPLDDLRRFGERMYLHAGLTRDDARTVVDVQLEADLRGVDTHGFQRLPQYVERLIKGENNRSAAIRPLSGSGNATTVDGDNGLGQLVCVRAMEMTIDAASATGIAVTTVRNSNDWGCGAYYPMMAAARGFVSLCASTSVPTLAPYGGRTRVLGNNPISFAVPRRAAPPIVLDMALTPVALGKLMRARAEGEDIPGDWGFLDNDGHPTTDPLTALRGIIPAIGGYKGIGLSIMVNVLAGVLAGGGHTGGVAPGRRGQFLTVFSPPAFGDPDSFLDEIENMVDQIKSVDRLPGVDEVYLPGELEQRRYDANLERGTITYPPSVISALAKAGSAAGVPFPAEPVSKEAS